MVQLSHPHMTTGKTIALTRQTFVGKVMSLLFNKLSRLVIAFLPRSKRLLISWLQSLSAVILEPPKIKSVSIVFPSVCHEMMGPDEGYRGRTGDVVGGNWSPGFTTHWLCKLPSHPTVTGPSFQYFVQYFVGEEWKCVTCQHM